MKMNSPAQVPQNERDTSTLATTGDPAIEALWESFVASDMAPEPVVTSKHWFYYANRQILRLSSALEAAEAKIAAHNEKHTLTYGSSSDEAWKRNPRCTCGQSDFPCSDAIAVEAR
jgi:hypothetical protein